jgi:alpha-galactosidase
VDYQSWRFTGTTNNRAITIKLRPDLLGIGSNFVFGVPLTLQPTNGAVSNLYLLPAGYALMIDQVSGVFPFDVPDSTNRYNLVGLINRGIYVYNSNNVSWASVAGANIRITETNGTNTVTFNPTNAVNVVLDAAGKERLFMDESTLDVDDSRGNTIFESTTNGITTLYTDRISVGPAPRFIADTTKTGIYDETGGHSIEIKANGTIGVQGTLTGNGGGLTNLARSNTNADGIVSSNQVAMLNTAQGWSQAASPTPPMGWNSWAAQGSGVDGASVTNAANALVANGLNRFGYEYVVVDDGWQDTNGTGRNVDGTLRANTNKFPLPGGITNVIAHVHAQGLKFGIYFEGGNITSGGFPASRLTNDVLDASTFASWGIDFLRYGGVTDDQTRNFVYWLQKKSSHPIFVELIPGSDDVSGQFPGTFGQLHWDPWNYGIVGSWPGGALRHWNFDGTSTYADFILYLADIEQWAKWSSPGHYQNGYFYLRNALANYSQRKSAVSMFSMLNIMLMQDTTTADFSMTNKNVFEVLNDRLGIAGYSQSKSNGSTAQVFIKPLGQKVGGDVAVALMNQSNGVQSITVNLTNIVGLSNVVTVFDCWSNCWVTVATNQYTMTVPAQGCELLRMRPGIYSPLLVPNSYYASDLQWIGTATNHDTGNETLIKRDVSYDGNPIQINAVTYGKCLSGVGDAIVEFYTGGRAVTFVATVGGDWVNRAFTAPDFQAKVYADDVLVFTTKKIAAFADSADISVDVTGAKKVGVRIVNPDSAGGTSNDRFIIANPLFVTSRAGQEVEYLRTTELSYASGTPASFFKPGSEGPGNSAYTEGFALNGGTGYTVAWTVPNWCQQATIEMPLLVLSANVAWTNTILALYSSRNTDARVFTSYDVPCLVNNGQTTLVTSVTFANTNALKRIQWVFNAGTNSATARNVGSPWKVTYQ